MKILSALLLVLPFAAAAQSIPVPAPGPPNDAEILQSRAQAAEARADYLAVLIRRLQAEDAKTAQWWADYIKPKDEAAK